MLHVLLPVCCIIYAAGVVWNVAVPCRRRGTERRCAGSLTLFTCKFNSNHSGTVMEDFRFTQGAAEFFFVQMPGDTKKWCFVLWSITFSEAYGVHVAWL